MFRHTCRFILCNYLCIYFFICLFIYFALLLSCRTRTFSCSDSTRCALCLHLVLSSTSSARHRSDQTVAHFHPLSAAEQDVASLRVKKFETVFAQQSVRLPAAKVSRLAHDGGNQPMAPELSSGAPRERETQRDTEREGERGSERVLHGKFSAFWFQNKSTEKMLKKKSL